MVNQFRTVLKKLVLETQQRANGSDIEVYASNNALEYANNLNYFKEWKQKYLYGFFDYVKYLYNYAVGFRR